VLACCLASAESGRSSLGLLGVAVCECHEGVAGHGEADVWCCMLSSHGTTSDKKVLIEVISENVD
jgi:hypothetical protein